MQSPGSYLSAQGVPTGYAGEKIIGTMTFAPSIWALEIDGKPALAFEAMKYREADEICHHEWLRLELGQRKINDVPLCGADSHLRIRLARWLKWTCIGKRRKLTSCQMTIWSI